MPMHMPMRRPRGFPRGPPRRPPPGSVPPSTPWTSILDRRTNPNSFYGPPFLFGNGVNHHDAISFSLDNDRGEGFFVVRNPVKPVYFEDLKVDKLKDLLKELEQLQASRMGAWDQGREELEMRKLTIDNLKGVLEAKGEADDDSDDSDDEDGDDKDDDS